MVAGMFLTADEVRQITDRKYHKSQREALTRMHIPFDTSANGRPLVLRTVYIQRHQAETPPSNEPDFGSIIRRYGTERD
jgi:hypothetical protein